MAVLETLGAIFLNILLPPFVFLLSLTLVLAAFGRSLGIRRLYVEALLKVFEYGANLRIAHDKERQSLFKIGQIPDSDTENETDYDSGCSDGETLNKLDAISTSYKKDDLASMELIESHDTEGDVTDRVELLEKAAIAQNGHLDKPKLSKYMSRHNVISRKDNLILKPDKPKAQPPPPIAEEDHRSDTSKKILQGKCVSLNTFQRDFELSDVFDYVKTGVASIIEDEVTQRFVAEELKSWNFLTRTSGSFEYINMKLTLIWVLGCFVRYCILLPGRIAILIVGLLWMTVSMVCVAAFPQGPRKRWLNHQVFTSCFQVLGGALSAVVIYHDTENRPKSGICVANHTSPIDVLILACDNAYALIGQSHGGFFGYIQRQLSKASPQIWFDRSESKDRELVFRRLKEHVEDPNKLPILIFPEGTCINNTSVMQFKKGSFEVGGTIYPVAIKYDPKFGDAFWNSSEYSMVHYLYMMMTSWAIVCDVWYLPPMVRGQDEDAIKFANRVKNEIAKKGGLVDLMWDGNLKRNQVKSEWKAGIQQEFSQRIKVD